MDKAFPSGGKDWGFKSPLGLHFFFMAAEGDSLNTIARSAGLNMVAQVEMEKVF